MQLLSEPRYADFGAGQVGSVSARMAIFAGYNVSIAASGDPKKIELMTEILVPGAEPRWAAEAVADADIVVLSIPLHRFADLDPGVVADKLVVDAMNYWPPVNGVVDMFEDCGYTSSEIVQRRLALSTVVKTLNPIAYHGMEDDRRPAGPADRRPLGRHGDVPGAVDAVAEGVERIGDDALRVGSLS